ncbi:MAG: ABC transporter permease [Thermodesulfobacteriota bacterium]
MNEVAEAGIPRSSRALWQSIKDFVAARTISTTGIILFLLLATFLLWPLIAVLIKSIAGSEGFTLQHYQNFLTKPYYYQSLINTLILGVLTTSVCIGVGFIISYITIRGPRFLRKPLKMLALLPLIAPPYIFALSLIILLGRNGIITKALNLNLSIYGFSGCVIAQTLAFLPLAYLMIENSLSTLNPNLEDSAANLGASQGKILRSIIIPLVTPGILKAALIVFVMAISEFGNVAILCGRTPFLAPDIYTIVTGIEMDFSMGSVLSMFLILPCAVIFVIQNYLIKGKGYTTILGKPVAAEPRRINPAILIPFLLVSIFAGGLVLLTFGIVGMGTLTNIVGVDNTFTLNHLLDWRSNMAMMNSLRISLLSGFFGAIIGVLLAYVIVRGNFRGRTALEGIAIAGFTLPGTVLGIGYIFAFNKPPLLLTGTMMILVINCAFRFLAVGMEAGINKLHQLSIEVEEASLNLGASAATTFRRIVLPIVFPAFMYGFMYVFMTSMVSLSAVIFLVSPGQNLASVFIFQWANYGYIGLASATTYKLIAIVGASLAIIQALSRWTGLRPTAGGGGA